MFVTQYADNSFALRNHRTVRDHLRNHPRDAAAYCRLKKGTGRTVSPGKRALSPLLASTIEGVPLANSSRCLHGRSAAVGDVYRFERPFSYSLCAALGRVETFNQRQQRIRAPTWRTYSVNAASLVAGTARLTSMAFVFSWLLSGGSPRGMDPSPGLWKPLGPIIKWTLVASIAQQASFAPQPCFFSWA
jgi:hypothetical protein